MAIELTSAVFSEGEMIPVRHTCDGEDVSPPLNWTGAPDETAGLALVCDDPDAPVGTWDHWVLFNIPAETTGLPEAIPADATLESGAVHGCNSWGRLGYGGPCPPGGTHRYFFYLYALSARLSLQSGVTKQQLQQAMQGLVLDQGQLMGRYQR